MMSNILNCFYLVIRDTDVKDPKKLGDIYN